MSVNLRTRHVVVVGTGFGGVTAPCELCGKRVEAALFDQQNDNLFPPRLYQVAKVGRAQVDMAAPICGIVGHHSAIQVTP